MFVLVNAWRYKLDKLNFKYFQVSGSISSVAAGFNIPKPSMPEKVILYSEKLAENLKGGSLKQKFTEGRTRLATECIFGNSPYLSQIIINYPEFYISCFEQGFENRFLELMQTLKGQKFEQREEIESELRKYKSKAALLIAVGEICGEFTGAIAMRHLSEFADLCVNKSVEYLLLDYQNKKQIKLINQDRPIENSGLVIIGVGKLGSFELNYSSDIDLAVFFEEEKLEYTGRKTLHQFYIELAQELTDIMAKRTRDGYVFRVDMRLRPDPASNPLAVSLKKAENYYFTVGQNWERAAMIKARMICGDEKSGEIFFSFMDKNVWRRTLDFETIEDIHSIKRQIDTKQGMHPENLFGYNLKLGRGGIREIEFYAQTQQLIWGGRKPELREKDTVKALYALVRNNEIAEGTAIELEDAYKFYRMVEHRLQMINDEQTHDLPKEPSKMAELAIFCGFDDDKEFINVILEKISTVRKHYQELFVTSPSLAVESAEATGSLIFTGTENHPDTLETLSKMGYKDPNKVSDIVRGWHHGRYNCTQKPRSRAVLTKLMPAIISTFSRSPNPDESFIRFDEFLSRLPEKSQVFSMLSVNPSILELMSEIMGGYPEIAANLSRNPLLLDYVLSPEFYDALPEIVELEESVDNLIDKKNSSLDDIYEVIKEWANERKFHIGIQLIRDQISIEEVFLSLTNIAEVAIKKLTEYTVQDFEKEIGKIEGGKISIITMGKLGSRELTFNSDLDLAFVYDHPEGVFTVGGSSLSPAQYYIRIASKIIYALSSISVTGKLYEVDLRLRPLGESGPLATSLRSFDEYYSRGQKTGVAWLWEYMVLTKARVIGNDTGFNDKLQKIIYQKTLTKWSDEEFNKELEYIYKKFRDTKRIKHGVDIKNMPGGLFDMEFFLRALQLKNLSDKPNLYAVETNKCIDNLSGENILSQAEADDLKEIFRFYTISQAVLRITSEENLTSFSEKVISKLLEFKPEDSFPKMLREYNEMVKKIFSKHFNFYSN